MQIGRKGQGFKGFDAIGKLCERRHGGGGKKGRARRKRAAAGERAIERRVRRQGREECNRYRDGVGE